MSSPYSDNYRIPLPLQFKSTECLPFIRLCTRSFHNIISCNYCAEPAVHRVESVPPSVMVCSHHHFLSGPFSFFPFFLFLKKFHYVQVGPFQCIYYPVSSLSLFSFPLCIGSICFSVFNKCSSSPCSIFVLGPFIHSTATVPNCVCSQLY